MTVATPLRLDMSAIGEGMPDRLDPEYCRREAQRMRAKMASVTDPTLRKEFEKVADHFKILADEIEKVKRLSGALKP